MTSGLEAEVESVFLPWTKWFALGPIVKGACGTRIKCIQLESELEAETSCQ